MQLVNNQSPIKTDGFQSTIAFGIKVAGKAFQQLVSGIYTNKIRAFIRELSTNAYEAHQMANKETVPFDVTLPNALNPSFKIRDYGIGLDKDEVAQVYVMLFESTKTNNNDLGGCFGLGSKSPFAYSDNFAVTCWKNGIKTTYMMHKNNAGEPQAAIVNSVPSSEPTGVEVAIPIKASDFNSVRNECEWLYQWFAHHPNIIGSYNRKTMKVLVTGSNFKIIDSSNGFFGPHVRMGNIIYPVASGGANIHGLQNTNILVELNIGDVIPNTGRESLSYEAKTKVSIEKAFSTVIKEMADKLQPEIDKCDCYWNAVIKARDVCSNTPLKITSFKYKGFTLNEKIQGTLDESIGEHKYYSRYGNKFQNYQNTSIHPYVSSRFYLVDDKKAFREKIRSDAGKPGDSIEVYICKDVAKYQEFKDLLHITDAMVKRVSDIQYTAPPRAAVQSNRHKTKAFVWKYSEHRGSCWTDTSIDLAKDAGFYVTYFNNSILINTAKGEREIHPKELQSLITCSGYGGSVYGFKKDFVPKVQKFQKWVPFLDHAKTLMYNTYTPAFLQAAYSANEDLKNLKYEHGMGYIDTCVAHNVTPTSKEISDFIDNLKKAKSIDQKALAHYQISMKEFYPDITNAIVASSSGMKHTLKKIVNKYPLIKYINGFDKTIVEELNFYLSKKG